MLAILQALGQSLELCRYVLDLLPGHRTAYRAHLTAAWYVHLARWLFDTTGPDTKMLETSMKPAELAGSGSLGTR